tara:strand:- start:122 stop:292 length:171 start_codon:yes stop_codon:yes gene_type:complete
MSELQFKLQLTYLKYAYEAYANKKISKINYKQIKKLISSSDKEIIRLGIKKFHLCQ